MNETNTAIRNEHKQFYLLILLQHTAQYKSANLRSLQGTASDLIFDGFLVKIKLLFRPLRDIKVFCNYLDYIAIAFSRFKTHQCSSLLLKICETEGEQKRKVVLREGSGDKLIIIIIIIIGAPFNDSLSSPLSAMMRMIISFPSVSPSFLSSSGSESAPGPYAKK